MNSIDFYFEDVDPIQIHKKVLILHLNSLIKNELKKSGEISVIFCSDNFLLQMNKDYLDHDYYTDIITFDYVEEDKISGDLFISLDRVRDNAKKYKTTVIHELYRVVFHGTLHLVGYNDKSEVEQKLMKEKENYYLELVDFNEMKL